MCCFSTKRQDLNVKVARHLKSKHRFVAAALLLLATSANGEDIAPDMKMMQATIDKCTHSIICDCPKTKAKWVVTDSICGKWPGLKYDQRNKWINEDETDKWKECSDGVTARNNIITAYNDIESNCRMHNGQYASQNIRTLPTTETGPSPPTNSQNPEAQHAKRKSKRDSAGYEPVDDNSPRPEFEPIDGDD
jgi:hypothetical protein